MAECEIQIRMILFIVQLEKVTKRANLISFPSFCLVSIRFGCRHADFRVPRTWKQERCFPLLEAKVYTIAITKIKKGGLGEERRDSRRSDTYVHIYPMSLDFDFLETLNIFT